MDLNNKVTQLEDEIKVLKKEVQAVLLDLRENMLNRENPFSPQSPAVPPAPTFATPIPPVEEGKGPKVKEKLPESSPVKPKVDLPQSITGAFQADEPVEFPQKRDTILPETGMNDMVLAWKPAGDSGKSLSDDKEAAGARVNKNALESITRLMGWVETSVGRLGYERTQAILDISEMMGHMSTEMKNILVKFMRPGSEPVEKVVFKDYMASLIELASLLGKKNDPNNVLFYTLYHGMYSMTEGREKHG